LLQQELNIAKKCTCYLNSTDKNVCFLKQIFLSGLQKNKYNQTIQPSQEMRMAKERLDKIIQDL